MTSEKKYRTGHLVDKELFPIVSSIPLLDASIENLPTLRAYPMFTPIDHTGVAITTLNLPPRDGAPSVTVKIFSPAGNTAVVPGYLTIHGGGYYLGTADMDRNFAIHIVRDCGVVVVSADYRLAPECNKMDLVEDCYTAFLWMHEHGHEYQIDKERLGFGGQSAGGGLAAALALLARDRKVIRPVFQLLEYPMLDDRTCTKPPGNQGEFICKPEHIRFGWSCLLGDIPIGAPDTSPYIVPARATDLSGLPPTFIFVGSLDLFLDESIEHARKLLANGVSTELIVYPGLVHGGNVLAPDIQLSKRILRNSLDAIRRNILQKSTKKLD